MKLNKHREGINSIETWKQIRPPKKGDIQWKEGRSAMELARYITADLPNMPVEIEEVLSFFVERESCFDWDAEYVTALPGRGEGRNHDAIMYNDEIFIGIEAKADEPLGRLIEEEQKNASDNKKNRISALVEMLMKEHTDSYGYLRYQLLTAATGTLIEAEQRGIKSAMLLLLVFESSNHTEKEKVLLNNLAVYEFLEATCATSYGDYWEIPNEKGIHLYFKKIEIQI